MSKSYFCCLRRVSHSDSDNILEVATKEFSYFDNFSDDMPDLHG